jgi:hypothetical protein
MRSATFFVLASLALAACCKKPVCPVCPAPLPPQIVEVVKPCEVPPPVITLKPEDVPSPDVAQAVTFSPEAAIRLGQSIVAWANFAALVRAKCGDRRPVRVP